MRPNGLSLRRLLSSGRERAGPGSFARAVFVVSGGTLAGQAIAAAASPLITRLYAPTDFGTLAIYISLLGLVSGIAMLRYESAIPVCERDAQAAEAAVLCLLVALASTVLVTVVLLIAGPALATHFELGPILPYLWIIPVGMVLTSIYQVLVNWAIRKRDYGTLARTKLSQNSGMVAAQITLGLLQAGPVGLLVGHVVGQSGGLGSLGWRAAGRDGSLFRAVTGPAVVAAARRYRRFPRFSSPAVLLEAGTNNVPPLFLVAVFGTAVAGWFALVQRTLAIPLNLFSASITQVYFGELADLSRSDPTRIRPVFLRRLRQTATLGALLVLPLVIVGYFAIPYVFGARWANSSVCLLAMGPALYAAFVASPFGCTLDVLQRQDLHFVRDLLRATLVGLALALSYWTGAGWIATLAVLSLASCLCYAVYIHVAWLAVRQHAARVQTQVA